MKNLGGGIAEHHTLEAVSKSQPLKHNGERALTSAAHCQIWPAITVGKRSSGSQRKQQTSPAYLRQAQEMRLALRMARNIREGHQVGWLITRRLKTKGMGI